MVVVLRKLSLEVVTVLCLLSTVAAAQVTSATIAGVARDATGAVLPGVTVEASSPALIEKVRTVVTDSAGRYSIIDLRPGVYTVTFTLAGFSAVQHEGIELTTGFTANVNADMRVGSVEETITVSGASPVVDIQNTKQQVVMTREILDTVPNGGRWQNIAMMVPGVTSSGAVMNDVGGLGGQQYAGLIVHGGRATDTQLQVDGMTLISWRVISASPFGLSDGNFQEVALDVSAGTAEAEAGGVRVNQIPRDGGNTFRGTFYATAGHPNLQSSNITDDLRRRRLRDPNKLKSLSTVNPRFGGPIVRDRLWFFMNYTRWIAHQYVAGSYLNTNLGSWEYLPDVTKQAVDDNEGHDLSLRVTWQATPRNKFALFANMDKHCNCHFTIGGANRSEATRKADIQGNVYVLSWSSPVTNRLLIEGGGGLAPIDQRFPDQPDTVAPRIEDTGLGINYRAALDSNITAIRTATVRGSVSYVTGSHSAKAGIVTVLGSETRDLFARGSLIYRAVNGVPTEVRYLGLPIRQRTFVRPSMGLFAQDQWVLSRLTMNFGLRFDYFRSNYPDHEVPPTPFVPVSRFAPAVDAIDWKDLSPRFGVAYDLFGDGKTALKASLNRYVLKEGTLVAFNLNPLQANNVNPRRWTDANNDRVVQGDPLNHAANGELGPSTNLTFGQPSSSLRYDPDWSHGFGVRPHNWEMSAAVQHELIPQLSATVGYFRRSYGNFPVVTNLATPPSFFDPFCVNGPVDARLRNGGGDQICGLFDLNPSVVGQVDRLETHAANYGDPSERWSGVDVTMNARLRALTLQGGLSTGRTLSDYCDVTAKGARVVLASNALPPEVNNPTTRFCRTVEPFQSQVKFLGAYRLPWDVQLSGTFQSIPGPAIEANATFSNAQVTASLGRNLSSGSTVTIPLIQPRTLFSERRNQIDFRFAKTFSVGRARAQGMVDLYNAFNANPVIQHNNQYGVTAGAAAGATWLTPQAILPARLVKVGVMVDF